MCYASENSWNLCRNRIQFPYIRQGKVFCPVSCSELTIAGDYDNGDCSACVLSSGTSQKPSLEANSMHLTYYIAGMVISFQISRNSEPPPCTSSSLTGKSMLIYNYWNYTQLSSNVRFPVHLFLSVFLYFFPTCRSFTNLSSHHHSFSSSMK